MTYEQNFSLLETSVHDNGASHHLSKFYSNGDRVRDVRGKLVLNLSDVVRRPHFFCYSLYQGYDEEEKVVRGYVRNQTLTTRILTYLDMHHGKHLTNCSSFAHFLTTGEFVPCRGGDSNLILTQNMTTYSGQKIEVGDMLCVLYYGHRYHSRTERNKQRKHYRHSRKLLEQGESFLTCGMRAKHSALRAEDIRQAFLKSPLSDYHFLVCIDHKQSEPVFAQQLGRDIPGNTHRAPIVFSLGGYDPYPSSKKPPYLCLIRKGRQFR